MADSLNPSTVGPAVYLAVRPRAVRHVLALTVGVFVTNFVAGILLLLGPGQLLLNALPHPSSHTKRVLEICAGIVLIVVAYVIWRIRRRLLDAGLPEVGKRGAFVGGLTIMLVELPTAVPYFGVIATIIASGRGLPIQFGLLAVFNILFVAPLLTIALVVAVAPRLEQTLLEPASEWLTTHWPLVFATLALVIGLGLVAVGLVGLVH